MYLIYIEVLLEEHVNKHHNSAIKSALHINSAIIEVI
jgi:hypothetical protein